MENLLLLLLGILIFVIGIMNMRGNISTIRYYYRKNVKEEDIPKYGKTVGIGKLIIGIALAISYFAALWFEALMPYVIIAGIVVIGFAFILYGQIKYNHGIF